MARSAGAMIITRNTNARTRSWTIGEFSFLSAALAVFQVIIGWVTEWVHPLVGVEGYNESCRVAFGLPSGNRGIG
jgi:hypothetical protein